MGLPGAGKSTVKRDRMSSEIFVNVEPDQLKRYHKNFSSDMGEDTDTEVHRWSVRRAVDAFEDAVNDSRRRNVLFDSSGSNSQWLARRLETARDAGYQTQLLWVDVPVEIALLRNRDRAKSRGQWCPENIIMDKAKVMQSSFEELRNTVDVAERLQNWDPSGDELHRAQEDLYLYPAPRSRATVRPGEPSYGEAPPGARPPSATPSSRRTIRIGPWKRNDEVMKAKSARLKWMDETYRGDREKFVLEEVLAGRDIFLERNMFPYALPPGMEHWTIWARNSMDHEALCQYIEGWLNARKPHNVTAWNYDDNRQMRTIDVWHVHVYFQGAGALAAWSALLQTHVPSASARTFRGCPVRRNVESSRDRAPPGPSACGPTRVPARVPWPVSRGPRRLPQHGTRRPAACGPAVTPAARGLRILYRVPRP
ncbi:unnamed protein product [Symbiodinium pilosum]|uniref:Zeta toxin domain-containing protein n=1 Tax=Symbiodinium pilosum TaxID=2952 RepID=A0A812LVU0_SYMPI|nr:unnamed protein product [Symbiodinium pilosum]